MAHHKAHNNWSRRNPHKLKRQLVSNELKMGSTIAERFGSKARCVQLDFLAGGDGGCHFNIVDCRLLSTVFGFACWAP